MPLSPRRRLFALALLLAGAASAVGQDLGGGDYARFSARIEPARAAPGDTVALIVTMTVREGHHTYGANEKLGPPTSISVDDPGGLEPAGLPEVPPGDFHSSEVLEDGWWLAGTFELRQALRIPADAVAGDVTVKATVHYQVCDDRLCYNPDPGTVQATLTVDPEAASAARSAEKIRYWVRFEPEVARPGEIVSLVVDVTVDDGWHLYGAKDDNPTELLLGDAPGFAAEGGSLLPDGEKHEYPEIDVTNYWIEGSFTIRRPFRVGADVTPGTHAIPATLKFMPCTPDTCLAPQSEGLAAVLAVEAGEARAAFLQLPGVAAVARVATAAGRGGGRLGGGPFGGGLLAFLLASIGGGLLALVMPCTYPMIPITISFFTKQAEARGGDVRSLSLLYGAGIVLCFVVIGVVIGPVIQRFAAHPVTNAVIAALFVVFALALFGVISLQPPRFLMRFAGEATSRGGYGGVFLMGATLVVTSFTCTGPFVGAILGASGKLALWQIALGMGLFGLTMAVPFVLLAMFPSAIQSMPRSGMWMNKLKVVFGFVELAAALKFVSNVDQALQWGIVPREVFVAFWALCFGAATLYLLGAFSRGATSRGRFEWIGAGVLGALTLYVASAFAGVRHDDPVMGALLPRYSAGVVWAPPVQAIKDDYPAAVAAAKLRGVPLLVNFTGFV